MSDLFCGSLPSKCSEMYKRLRGSKDEGFDARVVRAREHCEDLWADFGNFADPHFKQEFARRPHQRWFEMYLTVSLARSGHKVECRKPGPDVLLHVDGQRIWIEAVCATSGEPGWPDSVPGLETGKARREPTEQYVLRVRNALDEKQKKYRKYVKDGIVSHDDVTVVALNVYEIDRLGPHIDAHIRRSLYGVGDPILQLDRWRRPVGIQHAHFEAIRKSSGASVSLMPFVDRSTMHVSALLASDANMANRPAKLGDDFVLYPNVSGQRPWRQGILKLGREWRISPRTDGWRLTLVGHDDSRCA